MKLLSIILSIVISTSVDCDTALWLGKQTTMHLQVQTPAEQTVQFPTFGQEVTQGIEIISRNPIDTIREADNLKLTQDLIITSFKDSLYYIDSIPFVANGDTLYSDGFMLNVIQPFVIDTADNAIIDIKDIIQPPIWWWGIIRWILLGLLIICLGVAIWLIIKNLRSDGEIVDDTPKEPLRPADTVALEKLNIIKEEKKWQQDGKTKEYYSDITDVLREYISRVFEIDSVEMTTYEILGGLKKPLKDEGETWKQLKNIFSLADLVKFAKWSPLPDENESIVKQAIEFVNNTCHFIPESEVYDIQASQPTEQSEEKQTEPDQK